MKIYGYVRVSTREQHPDRQLAAMGEKGIPPENIFVDKLSGKDFDRPQYRKMCQQLDENSLVYIKSIDRLGRDYKEIIKEWYSITHVRKADIVVIDMPLLDTRRGKDLLGTFLSDVVLQVLSFVAENERQNIHQRQAEGIASAHKRGVRFGRPRKKMPENFPQEYARWQAGKCTLRAGAAACRMPVSTFYAKCRSMEDGGTYPVRK